MPRIQSTAPTNLIPEANDEAFVKEAPMSNVAPPSANLDAEDFLRYTDGGGDYAPRMNDHMENSMESDSEADFQIGAMDPMMQGDSQLTASALEAPNARNGFEQRWVRATSNGDSDNRNWLLAMKLKWRPRDPETVPKAEHYYQIVSDGTRKVFRSGDLVLCERPVEVGNFYRNEIAKRTKHQFTAGSTEAEKAAKDASSIEGFGGLQKQDTVTTTRGRRPATMVG
jgi:hypothetical protein